MGCSGLNNAGIRLDDLPVNVISPCDDPLAIVLDVQGSSVGSDEVRMGRLGDALIECAAEKQVAVNAYAGIQEILAGPQ